MNILIICYFSVEDTTPRAFRARSLYESLSRLGHVVTLVTPPKIHKSHEVKKASPLGTKIKLLARKALLFFLPDGIGTFKIPFFIKQLNGKNADITISVGLPFTVHLAAALAVSFKLLKTKLLIADYGDPYSQNPGSAKCFYAETMEKWVVSKFDIVTIPTIKAVAAFEKITTNKNKLFIIPQGYPIEKIYSTNYKKNNIPNFAYAGILYKLIRNPKTFFEHLLTIKKDFRFHIYTDIHNTETMQILSPYISQLKEKLIIHEMIPREQCIEALSSMDFLVNFSNDSSTQTPSKIVDYTISSRPFININQTQFEFKEFDMFFNWDFSTYRSTDISAFDENKVAKMFLDCATPYNA